MQNLIAKTTLMINQRESLIACTPICNEVEIDAICSELESLEDSLRLLESNARLACAIVENNFLDLVLN